MAMFYVGTAVGNGMGLQAVSLDGGLQQAAAQLVGAGTAGGWWCYGWPCVMVGVRAGELMGQVLA